MGNTQINETDTVKGFDDYLVASFTIVSLLEKYNLEHINLIKIDVEGHEYGVLNSLFEQNIEPENIIFEYIPDAFVKAPELLNLLIGKGYIIKDVNGNSYSGQKELPEHNLWAQKI